MTREVKFCCIGVKNNFDYTSISFSRKGSIEIFVRSCNPLDKTHDQIMERWKFWRNKYGWRCIKVYVTIEPVKK